VSVYGNAILEGQVVGPQSLLHVVAGPWTGLIISSYSWLEEKKTWTLSRVSTRNIEHIINSELNKFYNNKLL